MSEKIVSSICCFSGISFRFDWKFLLSPEKNNGMVISARSMEFLHPLNSRVVFFNRGDSFSSHIPDGSEAVSWENKY